jgi:mannose-6-phosphate isomerase-like protein (cupin superfamily)
VIQPLRAASGLHDPSKCEAAIIHEERVGACPSLNVSLYFCLLWRFLKSSGERSLQHPSECRKQGTNVQKPSPHTSYASVNVNYVQANRLLPPVRNFGEQIMPASPGPLMPVTRSKTIQRPSGGAITIMISSAESGGAMSMIQTLSPPGTGPSYHSHSREDETFYVVSGTAEIRLDDRTYLCEAGGHIFGPRNVFHTYRNVGDTDLKLVIVYSPGGFEQSFFDTEAMLQKGMDQGDVTLMLAERYGLSRS